MTKTFTPNKSRTRNIILMLLFTALSAHYSFAACQASFTYFINQQQGNLVLNSTSTGNNLSHHWQINGMSLYGQTVSWTHPGPGQYAVSLTVFSTTDSSCYSKITDTVVVGTPCSVNANFTYAVNYAQGKVYFNAASTANSYLYTWLINGTQYYGPNPVWTYPGPGYYNVTLAVFTPDSSCHDYKWGTVFINGQGCNANFSFHKDSFPGSNQYLFSPQYTDTFASHLWTFGDGDSSFFPSPSHQFPGPGVYPVCHTVSNFFDSCYAMRCDTIVVTDSINCNVNAQFYFYKDSMNKYHFVPQYASAPGTHYSWDFGDGQTSNQKFPVHQYNPQGLFHMVCLWVENPLDSTCFDYDCDTVISVPDSGCHANAGFTYQLQQVDSLGTYKIYKFTPDYLNASAYNYYWEFEPANSSNQPSPTYLFGTFKPTRWVCLTVTSKTNPACKARYCDTISIDSGCNANAQFTYTKNQNTSPYTYRFYSQTSNQYQHFWTFGTNQTYGGPSPIYTFPGPGAYKVCHTVKKQGDSTCFAKICDSILIGYGGCNAQFFDSISDAGRYFFPLSVNPAATYTWSFGDGDSATGYYQSHAYAMPGTYTVCLTVSSLDSSCKWCKQITIFSTGLNSKQAEQTITSLYPNPVIDHLKIGLHSRSAETIQVRVMSITGQLELEHTYLVPAGGSELEIDTRLLKQGIHFLELKGKETIERRKFLK